MLDKKIPYIDILMRRTANLPVKSFSLPEGFRYVNYKPGDKKDWVRIEMAVGEFDTPSGALSCFERYYQPYPEELRKNCLFIENQKEQKVATLTHWWNPREEERNNWLHWFGVHPNFQGLGLGKALLSEFLTRFGHTELFLHTQTWSYKAVGLYLSQGFEMIETPGFGGYANERTHEAKEILEKYLK